MPKKDYHKDNNSFIVYKEWYELFDALENDEQRGQLMTALFRFAMYGTEPEFSGSLRMAFIVMKQALERDGIKWEEVVEKRAKSGACKGKAKDTEITQESHEKANASKCFSTSSEKANADDNDNVNDNVNVNVIDNVNDNVNVNVNDNVNVSDSDILKKSHAKKSKEEMHFYDVNNIIPMRPSEYSALCNEYGDHTVNDMIARMSDYCLAKGKDYNDYAAALRNWIRNDIDEAKRREKEREPSYYVRDDSKYYDFMGTEI